MTRPAPLKIKGGRNNNIGKGNKTLNRTNSASQLGMSTFDDSSSQDSDDMNEFVEVFTETSDRTQEKSLRVNETVQPIVLK